MSHYTKSSVDQSATGTIPRPRWAAPTGAAIAGAVLGAAAKLADQSGISGLADLGTYLGAWVLMATLIAAWSPSKMAAALRVGILMFAMVGTYYTVTLWLFDHFPTAYFLSWTIGALLAAPLFAILAWPSRQQGWVAALAAALPAGLLLAEAYSFRWVLPLHLTQCLFDIAAAATLLWILPRTWSQRRKVLSLVPMMFVAGVGLHRLMPYVAGLLYSFGLRI